MKNVFNVGDLVKAGPKMLSCHKTMGIVIKTREWPAENMDQSVLIHWAGDYGLFWAPGRELIKMASCKL